VLLVYGHAAACFCGRLPETFAHVDLLKISGKDFRITTTGQKADSELAIFTSLKMRLQPEGDQVNTNKDLSGDKSKSLQESRQTPSEASHDLLSVTPPSHFTHQKAKG